MSNFFLNSSEILTLALLNNKQFHFNQEEMASAIGCTQPNISYVISSLLEKGAVENIKGFIAVSYSTLNALQVCHWCERSKFTPKLLSVSLIFEV